MALTAAPAPEPLPDALIGLARAHSGERPFVLGLCGAQGSGKSTVAAVLVRRLRDSGTPAATLSLDDLYLTLAERRALAHSVHPLFATRGVPGTHDVALGLAVLGAFDRGEAFRLPRFDKARDDRAPESQWEIVPPGLRVLVLEGWCVGARPQAPADLLPPINRLEALEDPDGTWRTHANACLAGPYQHLFARLDALAMLAAPSFDVVLRWRTEQERALGEGAGMDAPALARFVQFYERLTRHILDEMPHRADLVASLAPEREIVRLRKRETPSRRA